MTNYKEKFGLVLRSFLKADNMNFIVNLITMEIPLDQQQ